MTMRGASNTKEKPKCWREFAAEGLCRFGPGFADFPELSTDPREPPPMNANLPNPFVRPALIAAPGFLLAGQVAADPPMAAARVTGRRLPSAPMAPGSGLCGVSWYYAYRQSRQTEAVDWRNFSNVQAIWSGCGTELPGQATRNVNTWVPWAGSLRAYSTRPPAERD